MCVKLPTVANVKQDSMILFLMQFVILSSITDFSIYEGRLVFEDESDNCSAAGCYQVCCQLSLTNRRQITST